MNAKTSDYSIISYSVVRLNYSTNSDTHAYVTY